MKCHNIIYKEVLVIWSDFGTRKKIHYWMMMKINARVKIHMCISKI